MKTILTTVILSLGILYLCGTPRQGIRPDCIYLGIVKEKTYCDGWSDGYPEGWKDVKGKYAIAPVTPICPIPEVDKTTYTDGYNRGFKQGIKDAKE